LYRKINNGTIEEERKTVSIYDMKITEEEVTDNENKTKKAMRYELDPYRTIARLETATITDSNAIPTPEQVIRFQCDNHLGSACLELNEDAEIISYEEYYPFGSSSYCAMNGSIEVSKKRYRFCGKERDEETGLYYYGMRYYAAWICRFVSVDPLQHEYPNLSPYVYCNNNPINLIDPTGMSPEDTKPGGIALIDSFSGNYLGSYTSDQNEGFSVRSIASCDFNNLQNNDFADSRYFSIDKSSKEVTVDYDQIAGAIGSILEKTDKMIGGNLQEIEKSLFIVFDKEKSSIYAIVHCHKDNTGSEAKHPDTNPMGNSHRIISDNRNLVIMAEMHTHPGGSVTEFFENSKPIGSYQYRDAGVSPGDDTTAQKLLAPVYAIAKFKTDGTDGKTQGNIFRVNPDGKGADSKKPIGNINNSFNLIKNIFDNRRF
jgi:RHS repeat-associated protein